jgi:hypothetical protein
MAPDVIRLLDYVWLPLGMALAFAGFQLYAGLVRLHARLERKRSDQVPPSSSDSESTRSGPLKAKAVGQGGGQALDDRPMKIRQALQGRYFRCPDTGRVMRDLGSEQGRSHVRLDLTPQVLSLTIPDDQQWQGRRWLFPTHPLHEWGFTAAGPASPPMTAVPEGPNDLSPTCPYSGFVSASMLAVKAKLFDDGLYAAAEVAAQPGKAKLLAALADVAAPIAAAARLGGMDVPLSAAAARLTEAFLADELVSKPLGFYTWSDSLRRIFKQDRLLQRELAPADARSLAAAVNADPTLARAYGNHVDLMARLTNPPPAGMEDLRQPLGTRFFPPSRSHEGDLGMMLFGDRPVPEGFSLSAEMVRRLRDGSLRADPTAASGWYDFQTWALEALVTLDKTAEAARLVTNDRYREQLEELFKSLLALSRETHAKQVPTQLLGGMPDATPLWVDPELTVEPVATYYERRAQGYEFVREVLGALGSLTEVHRLTADGPVPQSLDEELAEITAIFRGAAAVASQELGMAPAEESDIKPFRKWAESPDIAVDIRMMVPVFYDIERRKTRVWAILGWETRPLIVSFATPPAAQVLSGNVEVTFGSDHRRIAYPVFADVYVSRLLDRDEFRARCDRHKTRAAILQNL